MVTNLFQSPRLVRQWISFTLLLVGYCLPAQAQLIPDGSFETCYWDCSACNWDCSSDPPNWLIANPEGQGWGISAYHGSNVGWLGGLTYEGNPIQSKLCNVIPFMQADDIEWYWTAYVNEGSKGNLIRATMNDEVVYEKTLSYPEDHTWGTWQEVQTIDLDPWCYQSDVTFCIEIIPTDGASYLVDYFWGQRWCDVVSTEDMSFSAVKSLYR